MIHFYRISLMSLNFFIGLLYFLLNISFVLVYSSISHVKYIYLPFVHHLFILELVCKFCNKIKIFLLKYIFVIIIIFTKWKFANFVKKYVLVNVVYLSTCTTALNVSKNLQILAKRTKNHTLVHTQRKNSSQIYQKYPNE